MSRSESEGTTSSPEPTTRAETDSGGSKAAPNAEVPPHTSGPSAEPKQELTLSESTLVWMVDSDKEAREPDPSKAPRYDFRSQLAGRRRVLIFLSAAGGVALIIALVLHLVAANRPPPVDDSIDSAAQITRKAENALAQGRTGEAIELAHLAIAANPRVAGAYAVVGSVARTAGRTVEAREAYGKYLELAPVGPHAAEARAALAALPP
jgi:cytochrome c-type biogenesis protein CcmH/NrfG